MIYTYDMHCSYRSSQSPIQLTASKWSKLTFERVARHENLTCPMSQKIVNVYHCIRSVEHAEIWSFSKERYTERVISSDTTFISCIIDRWETGTMVKPNGCPNPHKTTIHARDIELGDERSAKCSPSKREILRGFAVSGKKGKKSRSRLLLVIVISRRGCFRAPEEAARAAAKPGRRRRGARRWLLPTDTRDFGQLFDPRLAAASFHPHAALDPAFCIPRSASSRARLVDAP